MENRFGKWVQHCALAFALAAGSFSAHATLLGRDINGNPVAANDPSAVFEYDTDLNITWLRDWNYSMTSGYDTDGRMIWDSAVAWASTLTVGTYSGWRLPTTNTGPSSNCSGNFDPGGGFPQQYHGSDCTGSEMGHVWYTELGNTAGSLTNTDPFENLQSDLYWSGTEYAPDTDFAWFFVTANGDQSVELKAFPMYAVAVRAGDVAAAAPEPESLAVLLAGLVALSAARRRRPH